MMSTASYPVLLQWYTTTTYTSNGYNYSPVEREVKVFKINATQSQTITYNEDKSVATSVSIITT